MSMTTDAKPVFIISLFERASGMWRADLECPATRQTLVVVSARSVGLILDMLRVALESEGVDASVEGT